MLWSSKLISTPQVTFPNPGHRLINTAVPATTSSYISPCIHSLVPSDADLVIVEFSFNDGEMSGWTQVFDAPIRQAGQHPLGSAPACAMCVFPAHQMG